MKNLENFIKNIFNYVTEEDLKDLNKRLIRNADYHWEGNSCPATRYEPAESPMVVVEDYEDYEQGVFEYFYTIINLHNIKLSNIELEELVSELRNHKLIYDELEYEEKVQDYAYENVEEEHEPDYYWRED